MPGPMALDLPFPSRTLRLETLIRLRWMALVGQATAVLTVYYVLGFPLPIWECLAAIARVGPGQHRAAAALSRNRTCRSGAGGRLSGLSTSSSSPSCSFSPAGCKTPSPSSSRPGADLGDLAAADADAVSRRARHGLRDRAGVFHLPLPWFPDDDLDMPILYVAGMWFSVLLGLAFIGVYAWRVADEARHACRTRSARRSWCWPGSSISRSSTASPPRRRTSSARRSRRSRWSPRSSSQRAAGRRVRRRCAAPAQPGRSLP